MSPRALDAGRGLALAALLLYALNLRAPITAFAPVVGDVSADLHLTAAAAGLLTGAPVLCFAVATPLTAALVARLGTATTITAALVTTLVGTVLRSTGGFATALVGTVLIGAAITVGNVAVPIVVARDFSSGVAGVTGASTAAMNVGAVATTMGTAPLASLVGWRWALVSWGAFAVVGLVAWRLAHGRRGPGGRWAGERSGAPPGGRQGEAGDEPAAPAATSTPVLRRPVTWVLALTFAAQASPYYGLSAWLPSILHDQTGMSRSGAGAAAALFQGFGILGGVLAPVALTRLRPRAVTAAVAVTWLALPVGLLLAPAGWAVWASLGGIAQAGNYVVVISVIAMIAGSPAEAGRMSAVVQTVGYVFAGVAPSALGALHTASAGWTVPLLATTATLLVMTAAHAAGMRALVRSGADGGGPHPAGTRR